MLWSCQTMSSWAKRGQEYSRNGELLLYLESVLKLYLGVRKLNIIYKYDFFPTFYSLFSQIFFLCPKTFLALGLGWPVTLQFTSNSMQEVAIKRAQ